MQKEILVPDKVRLYRFGQIFRRLGSGVGRHKASTLVGEPMPKFGGDAVPAVAQT